MMAAWFEIDVKGGSSRLVTSVLKRDYFGVRTTELRVIAFAENRAVLRYDGSDERIGRRLAPASRREPFDDVAHVRSVSRS